MYQLASYENGKALITDDAAPYRAHWNADSETAAKALVVELNKPYLKTALATHRYKIETSGVTLGNSKVLTDRDSQYSLSAAHQSLTIPIVDSIDWKATNGWVTLTKAELAPISTAVVNHVQGCFKAERKVSEKIDSGDITEKPEAAFDAAFAALQP